ncbi:lytic transglycosylase domain-containing protein [Terriglobus sp.]|uniref:lytic transglycosylase domain-containing protein n=1 Tax=Terriglobus sp. TaxID=1889013 RepID=UPI003AFFF257
MSWCRALAVAALLGAFAGARAAERVTLRNGFAVMCDHRETLDAEHVRLYLDASSGSYMDVPLANIAAAEAEAVPLAPAGKPAAAVQGAAPQDSVDSLIQSTGQAHGLNIDLLRSVVNAESGGHIHAVSRAGAQGLMQLMPTTARSLGVADSFAADQNLRGGTDYLDSLLCRYHDDLSLALAAYNAGPGAVDRYHGVPPYRETQLYVARIIREFNRRTLLAQRSASATAGAAAAR